ncbi:DUF2284 domain-containing protein [Candidatus Hakubella thermalkaliphila]|uniref:DUF2284 domain-containing protein n=1 Tax=Candidatus Hakubella thermalkaliphila TaxID=2754717 RepID=A0A6V8Q6Y1_9ACTN|nr:DUF2284 domain-containing protein [Candidatus Hakubella thermalkaliphila]GFP30212.1 hypothetical protein HKBW3S34_01132 [Candidatus Hakubella thermalkaliphila]GFP40357.1 hypothetical protein HKBW3S47_02053 [Candidatus Hakubella thermalkaliphila]GFP41679.1 hypothetical protein HKBW3C_00804 [Candidatus Hakubella thermalkaliphila]
MEKVKARRVITNQREIKKRIEKDLDLYCQKAIELGASDARVVSAKGVVVDERVRLKCAVPHCHLYGSSPNCPPYTPTPDEVRKALCRYKYAILFKHDVLPKEDFVDPQQWLKGHEKHQKMTHKIASALESLAFNDGYYLAMGFAAGGCKTALCGGLPCQFLDSGRCRFPLMSRPSMEGMGIDAFGLAAKVGWEIYPVAHKNVDQDSISCAVSVGIVFVH